MGEKKKGEIVEEVGDLQGLLYSVVNVLVVYSAVLGLDCDEVECKIASVINREERENDMNERNRKEDIQ